MDHFSSKDVSISEIGKELRELNSHKVTTFGNIPTKILKQNRKSCSDTLKKLFPDKLKCADVTPIFQKDDPQKQIIIDQ